MPGLHRAPWDFKLLLPSHIISESKCSGLHSHSKLLSFKFLQHVNKAIATVILPNRPTDNQAGGSGAAGQWAGQHQGSSDVQPPPQH
jgi:hypothetical protein